MIFILAIIAIVFFVIGMALIFKSYSDIPEPEKIVPAEEVVKIKKDLDSSHQEEENLKQKLDALVLELEKARGRFEEATAKGQDTEALRSQIKDYEARVQDLVQSLEYLRNKADQQAQEAAEVLTSLQAENENLKNLAHEAERRVDPSVVSQLQGEKKTLEEKMQENLSKLKTMEQELSEARHLSQEQVSQSQKAVEEVKLQNEEMRQSLSQVSGKLEEMEAALTKEREEKARELAAAQGMVEEFKARMDELSKQKSDNDKSLQQLQDEIEKTRQQLSAAQPSSAAVASFDKERAMLEKNLEDLKAFNARLVAREKILQQELTKSRAQAMGLEKVCAVFKSQIEQSKSNNS